MNLTFSSILEEKCLSILLPFVLPFFTILFFVFCHTIINFFIPFNIKIQGKNYSSKIIEISQYKLSQFLVICITFYFWNEKIDYNNYMISVNENLAIKGWYLDYLGVLLLTFINSFKLEKINLGTIIIKFLQLSLIPGIHLLYSMVLLYVNSLPSHLLHKNYLSYKSYKIKNMLYVIIYFTIGSVQLYKWESIVYKYDLLFDKCFLEGFIDLSNPTNIYITVLMIIVYYYQVVLFANTIHSSIFFYILSVIAFMNGTIALSIYLIYFELFLLKQ